MYIAASRLHGLWQSHVHYSQSIIRNVTITCTLQSVDYTDRDNHKHITASRLYGPWQSHVHYSQSIIRTVTITLYYSQSIIRTVTITCTLQSVDYTDRDNHMYIAASRLYELWQSHVHYSQSIIRIATITCTLQPVDYTDCGNHMYITASRLYGSRQSHVHCSQSIIRTVTITCTLQSVDYTDRDNHMCIAASRLYGLWQSHVHYSQSIIRIVTITCTLVSRLYGPVTITCTLQSVDYTDCDNHMYITVTRLYGPWQSHVLVLQSAINLHSTWAMRRTVWRPIAVIQYNVLLLRTGGHGGRGGDDGLLCRTVVQGHPSAFLCLLWCAEQF